MERSEMETTSTALFAPSDEMQGVGSRGEFNRAANRAERLFCDGSCDEFGGHAGHPVVVRVRDGNQDWGFFSYCETAVSEDTRRGLSVLANSVIERSSLQTKEPDNV